MLSSFIYGFLSFRQNVMLACLLRLRDVFLLPSFPSAVCGAFRLPLSASLLCTVWCLEPGRAQPSIQ